MTEDQLLGKVLGLAADRSVLALHVPDGLVRQLGPAWRGWPDLILIGEYRVAWAELKADGRAGLLRPSQRQFARRLAMAGQVAYQWSPADLRSGAIGRALDALGEG